MSEVSCPKCGFVCHKVCENNGVVTWRCEKCGEVIKVASK